jgi:tRNA (cmo5U34)-methyltransferase
MDRIQRHFEEEAKEYDTIIEKLIPNYKMMVNALVSIMPFDNRHAFEMIDLGCGTGTVSKTVKELYPAVKVTCVDIAANMLDIAGQKVGEGTKLIQADFNQFEFPQKYDAVVSSLALHHLETDEDKLNFYRKIYGALNIGGIFINIDIVLGSSVALQRVYMQMWKAFMRKSTSEQEVEQKWIPTYGAEDRPTMLISHLDMLTRCGFTDIDVVYKRYNYAVYCGSKQKVTHKTPSRKIVYEPLVLPPL